MLLNSHQVEALPGAQPADGEHGQLAPAAHGVQRGQQQGGQGQDTQQDHQLQGAARQQAGKQVVGDDLLVQVGGRQGRAVQLAGQVDFQRGDGVKFNDVPHKLPGGKDDLGGGDGDGLGPELLPRGAGQRGPGVPAAGTAAVVGGQPRRQTGKQIKPKIGKNLHGNVIMGRQPHAGSALPADAKDHQRQLLGGEDAPQRQQAAPRQAEVPRGKGEGVFHSGPPCVVYYCCNTLTVQKSFR